MKAFIIINAVNDVLFLMGDNGFKQHVATFASGSLHNDSDLDTYVVLQLFSPLIASQSVMKTRLDNPYRCISTARGFKVVLQHYTDCIYMGVSSEDSEPLIRHELAILHNLITLLYGPCHDRLHPDNSNERQVKWAFVKDMMNCYLQLYHSEQAYLTGAVEQLHANTTVSQKADDLLRLAIQLTKDSGESPPSHVLLTVGAKVMASADARPLDSGDALLLLVLVTTLLHFDAGNVKVPTVLSPRTISSLSTVRHRKRPVKIGEKVATAGILSRTFGESVINQVSTADLSNSSEVWITDGPTGGISHCEQGAAESSDGSSTPSNQTPQDSVPLSSLVGSGLPDLDVRLHQSSNSTQPGVEALQSHRQTIVLRHHVPHTAYLLRIADNVSLLVLCQASGWTVGQFIGQALSRLRGLRYNGAQNNGQQIVWDVESCLNKVKQTVRKHKVNNPQVTQLLKTVARLWTTAKHKGLGKALKSKDLLNLQLETVVSNLITSLCQLYHILYLNSEMETDYNVLMQALYSAARHRLYDYMDYIYIKMQRNLSLTSYVADFPGLIHFIFINRSTNRMIAPAIDNQEHPFGNFKEKIWLKYEWFKEQLANGTHTVLVRDADLYYSYFLWFEDHNTGSPVVPPNPYRGIINADVLEANRFYPWLLRHCFGASHASVHCLEMVCVHMAIAPSQHVLTQCRHLAILLDTQWGKTAVGL